MKEKTIIRQDTDYAFRMVVYLCEKSPREVPASELSEHLGVPHDFAQKILRKLSRAGILQARMGCSGGFMLIRHPAQISMMDVIHAIQGRPLMNRCTSEPDICPRQSSCPVSSALWDLQEIMDEKLNSMKISDVMKNTQPNSYFSKA